MSSAGTSSAAADLDLDEAMRRYRRELHVYCYRMLGSFDEAEDHVQEVFLRAWRSRDTFDGRAGIRTWLYRIATNACLDTLRRDRPRTVPDRTADSTGHGLSVAAMSSMQPYPDRLLDELSSDQPGPETVAVTRESLALAYLRIMQLLPPRQRVVLILRDVMGWPASDVAALTDSSVPAVKSALQRARATLHKHRTTQPPAPAPPADQRRLLQAFIAAHENADPEALIDLLGDDVRLVIAPQVGEWNGRQQVAAALRDGMTLLGAWRVLPTAANGQPAAIGYLRRPNETIFLPFAISVLDIQHGELREIAAFEGAAHLVTAFGLPTSL